MNYEQAASYRALGVVIVLWAMSAGLVLGVRAYPGPTSIGYSVGYLEALALSTAILFGYEMAMKQRFFEALKSALILVGCNMFAAVALAEVGPRGFTSYVAFMTFNAVAIAVICWLKARSKTRHYG